GGYTSLPGMGRTGSAGAAPSFSTTSARSTSEARTKYTQIWPRTFRRAADFQLMYEYQVEVSSVRLNDSAVGFLANRVISMGRLAELLAAGAVSASDTVGLTGWMDKALGRAATAPGTQALPAPVTGSGQTPAPLPAPAAVTPVTVNPATVTPVAVTLRFPGSEAPVVRADGAVELPAPPPVLITPHVHPADPRSPGYSAARADVTAGSGPDPRAHLDRLGATSRWTPTRPLAVYDFDALDELTDALNTVDPGLRGKGLPKTSLSAEATMRRIGNLIRRGTVTLTPAQASRFTGRESSGGSAHLVTTLYRPQIESLSRDVVSQGMRTTTHTIAAASSRTLSPSVTAPMSGGLTEGNADAFASAVPLAGENDSLGESTGTTGLRREVLKYGTPVSENPEGETDDSGVLGFTVTSHVVLEVTGPEGTRWVTGNVVLRPTLEDVLGLGIAPPRPSPAVYDAPAVLAAQDIHDWRALRRDEFGDRLVDGFTDEDARAQIWLDAGEIPDGVHRSLNAVRQVLKDGGTLGEALDARQTAPLPTDIALALYAADRAADLSYRPVELVLRTADGQVHLPFTPAVPVPTVLVTPPDDEPTPDASLNTLPGTLPGTGTAAPTVLDRTRLSVPDGSRRPATAGTGASFSEALADVLRRGETPLFDEIPALTPSSSADTVHTWLGSHIAEDDIPRDAPLPSAQDSATIDELVRAGMEMTTSRRTQAEMLGGLLQIADSGLTRTQRFLLLLDRASADDAFFEVYAAVAARVLGVHFVIHHPNGEITHFGTGNEPTLILTIVVADRSVGGS
ncbi:MAG TPA: hypothetical protein VFH94_01345, partial [Streptomyces sp.]|nr:hypothetical protein [Streptomyces sp.]